MNNYLFKTALVFFLTLPLFAFGQMPQWTQNAWRENAFPASEYYTGFVRDKLQSAAGIGNALKTLDRDAQNQLAESIIVNIEGDTRTVTASSSIERGNTSAEMVITDYRQAIQTATRATTVKCEVKSYHDTETGMIYAFAVVRRADLAAYYTKQINVDLNKVEVALGTAEQLVAAGKKMSARRQCLTAKSVLEGIAYSQDLLTA
ncbi:MAG: hypothetical protein LBC98_07615, partial [Prevotellaceae bacterium]|nr:hypothetical protein [Prevotellaceae bacterium]